MLPTRTAQLRKYRPSIIDAIILLACMFAFGLRYSLSRDRSSHAPVTAAMSWRPDTSSETGILSQDPKSLATPLNCTPDSPPVEDDPAKCFQKFPWIEGALEDFYKPARESFEKSLQTSEEFIESMDNITWVAGYHPGHDLITLVYNESLGRYDIKAEVAFPPNQEYKRRCVLPPLERAIEQHGAALAVKFDFKDIKFVVGTEDFGMTWRNSHYKLPAFSLCTDSAHTDIPIPDFTFGCYPEANYKETSWDAISTLLEKKSGMLPWEERENAIFHRSNWGVGTRRGLMPFLKEYVGNKTDIATFGARLDIKDTEFSVSNRKKFVWLDEQCKYKVAIHTAGFSYSAGLKYKLACGQVVLKFDSDYREFYEPALQDGVHVIKLSAQTDGVDQMEFVVVSG